MLCAAYVPFGVMLALVALTTAVGWGRGDDLHELIWAAGAGPADGGFHFGVWWFSFVSRPLFTLALVA